MIWNFVYVVFVVVCIFLVITVLLQPGKSGGLGAAFGGGGNTVFGASGGTPVFRRMTTGAAICFMILSLLLAWGAIDKSSVVKKEKKVEGLDFSDSQDREYLEIPESVPAAESFVTTPADPDAPVPASTDAVPAMPSTIDTAPAMPSPTLAPTLNMPGLGGLLGNEAFPAMQGSDFGIPTLGSPSLGDLNVGIPTAIDAPAGDVSSAPEAADSAIEAPAADSAIEAPAADSAIEAPAADSAEAPAEVPAA